MSDFTFISQRAGKIDASGIRKVFDLAADLKHPVNLSIGQPHFDVHPELKAEACRAIQEGFNRYTPSAGLPELKQVICSNVPEAAAEGTDLLITGGVSGGIVLAILAMVDPGDEVILPDPGFVSYKHVVAMAGGVPVFVDTYPDFRMYAARIEEKISERTKLLVLNSPSNPTGMVYTHEEIQQTADLCSRHGIAVISDEIYRMFTYDREAVSISSFYENTVVLRGFSKDYAMTGWRMGYAFGPSDIIQAMVRLQQFSFVCAPSFAQKACVKAFSLDISDAIREYEHKRDLVFDGLRDRFELDRPEGAFYCFVKAPGMTGTEFVKKAIDKELLIIPGGVFSERDTHFRISYAAADDELEKGIDILNSLA